jgi:uncharacterized membrane protein
VNGTGGAISALFAALGLLLLFVFSFSFFLILPFFIFLGGIVAMLVSDRKRGKTNDSAATEAKPPERGAEA